MSEDRPDPRIRELTYQLMGMAPDAPPFPEEATAMTVPATKKRRPMLVWATAAAVVVLLVGLPLFLFRGDGGTTDPATTIAAPDTTTTTVAEPSTTVAGPAGYVAEYAVYLFSDAMTNANGDTSLTSVLRIRPYDGPIDLSIPPVLDVETLVRDAVTSLVMESPEAGFSTSVPPGLDSVGITLNGRVAVVDLPAEFEAGGGTMAMATRLAQVVYTATQFPKVDSVLFMIDGQVVEVFSGEGLILDGPQTREDYHDILPYIFLDTPAIGSIAPSPAYITGTANVFEATVSYEIVDAEGNILNSGFTTATCGTGCWGEFRVEVPYDVPVQTQGEIVVYEESPEMAPASTNFAIR
jgi:hypothetical protein